MAYDTGRSSEFQGGYEEHFRSIQQGAGRYGHHPTSILEQIQRSPNGLGPSDRGRMLVDGNLLPSTNGRSQQTADRRQYFDSPYRNLA